MPQGPQAMAPYGQGAPMVPPGAVGTLPSAGTTGGPGPTRRNPWMTLLLPIIIIVGGGILGSILAHVVAILGLLVNLVSFLVGAVLGFLSVLKMVNEVKTVTRNAAFPWWPMIIPFYGIYWACMMLPGEVNRAKQMMGVQAPTRGLVAYLFLMPYALAADINDMVR
jgi:hypothetical protein